MNPGGGLRSVTQEPSNKSDWRCLEQQDLSDTQYDMLPEKSGTGGGHIKVWLISAIELTQIGEED